jgi:ribosomal-protein-alanine N-acetyltransferase
MTAIETSRLLLRPFTAADIPAYAAIRAKPQVVRYLMGGAETAKQANEIARSRVTWFAGMWQEPGGFGPWAVIEQASGSLIGHGGLRRWEALGNAPELLYMLDDTAWGKGYASEIAQAALRFGFEALDRPEIVAAAAPENTASIRVMEKAGMRRDPGLIIIEGVQAVRCVLRQEDWRALQEE